MKFVLGLGALFLAGLSTASATNKYDVNSDGRVDARDADSVVMMVGFNGATGSGPAMPGSAQDLNGDGLYSLADWREFVGYVSAVGGYPEALFDVSSPGMGTPAITAADKGAIAMAVSQGRGGYYAMRYDFNADGVVNLKDWEVFLGYTKRVSPALLVDFDGNSVFNGRDLDRLAQMIDARSYVPMMDLNASGTLSAADWQAALQLASMVNGKAIFDVDGLSGNARPTLGVGDSAKSAIALNGMSVGATVSIRYDFDGNGVVQATDWTEWVRFVTMVYKQPDFLFDLDANGVVNTTDLAMMTAFVGVNPVQFQYDLNGDGLVNAADRNLLAARLAVGPLQLLAGDVNRDGCVTAADQALLQASQGAVAGSPFYDSDFDVVPNGYIGFEDMNTMLANLGRCR